MKDKELEKVEQLPEGISQSKLDELKKNYGKRVKRISLPLDDSGDEFFDVITLVPDRRVMGLFEKFMDKDPDKSKDILVKNCLMSGKDKVMGDDELFIICAGAIAETLPIRKAIIKNA